MKKTVALASVMALSFALVAIQPDAYAAQKRKTTVKKKAPAKKKAVAYSGPETGLLGVKIYDSGIRVIQIYGSPDNIQAIGVGGGAGAPGGGSGGPGGFGGPGGGGGGGGQGPGGQLAKEPMFPGTLIPGDLTGMSENNFAQGPRGGGAPAGGPPGGGRPGADGGGAPGGGAGAATESAQFVRWIYTRNGTKFAFVVDKFNRVVQIEAIGLQNQRVKTRRGIGFGSSFSQIMKAYSPTIEPDGYDIAGENFTIRFLTRQRVAFRLSRLSNKKTHVVTGIVVAAGKQ